MRVAEERREEAERRRRGGDCGRRTRETVEVWIDSSLFADDTMAVGHEELEGGVEVIKKVVGDFEECNNDDKEEKLVFGRRVVKLGCWRVGWSGKRT